MLAQTVMTRRNSILTIAFASLLAMCGCRRGLPPDPPAFRTHFDDFIREGSVLNSYTEQGVNYQTFGDQLARTKATFDILEPDWPGGRLIQKQHFINAIEAWSLTYKLWHRKVKGAKYLYYFGDDLKLLNEVLVAISMEPEARDGTSDQKASISKVIGLAMSYSADEFQKGRSQPISK